MSETLPPAVEATSPDTTPDSVVAPVKGVSEDQAMDHEAHPGPVEDEAEKRDVEEDRQSANDEEQEIRSAKDDAMSTVSSADSFKLPRRHREVTPRVRYYDYEGFMNRMDDDDGDFVVEVLVAKPNWHADVEAEHSRKSNDSDMK
ncbi:hypothetical protein CSOJ01_01566 [Colletotrichum sojae]|uniref:Uncharacterized protein n=1 Tax=Colletotrichum sojae TaxID=2175907 RepID=A0A8H6JT85_9PEZI|nr:hypothetical protein CSOJ01_01566 [Colletotrichum sojae]